MITALHTWEGWHRSKFNLAVVPGTTKSEVASSTILILPHLCTRRFCTGCSLRRLGSSYAKDVALCGSGHRECYPGLGGNEDEDEDLG